MDTVFKIRELRRLSGLSQKQVAKRSGVGWRTLSTFETGRRIKSLTLDQLERLLETYGVDAAQFFGGEVERLVGAAVVSSELTPSRNETIATLRMEGATYQEISDRLGISRQRALQIVQARAEVGRSGPA